MRIFVTGATGFVGSAIVQELQGSGHHVLGLARSDASAESLAAMGAEVHRGDLEDLESLRSGAAMSDGVIHAGFIHDFARFKEVCEVDRQAIGALGDGLAGSQRPLIVTSGTAMLTTESIATEDHRRSAPSDAYPRASEAAAEELVARGINASIVRLSPSVHGDGDHGFVPMLINIARKKGVSAYIGDGQNRWTAVHRLDAAHLFRLALEKAVGGARYHGVAEEGIAFKDIAQVIARRLDIPLVAKSQHEAAEHFSWFTLFAGLDSPATSIKTQHELGWKPKQLELIADMDRSIYFKAT